MISRLGLHDSSTSFLPDIFRFLYLLLTAKRLLVSTRKHCYLRYHKLKICFPSFLKEEILFSISQFPSIPFSIDLNNRSKLGFCGPFPSVFFRKKFETRMQKNNNSISLFSKFFNLRKYLVAVHAVHFVFCKETLLSRVSQIEIIFVVFSKIFLSS